MYKLVYTHTKSEIAHALSYATHTFYVSPQYQACSKSRERDIIIHVIYPKKNKARHKIKYFCHFKTKKPTI